MPVNLSEQTIRPTHTSWTRAEVHHGPVSEQEEFGTCGEVLTDNVEPMKGCFFGGGGHRVVMIRNREETVYLKEKVKHHTLQFHICK